MYMFSQLHKSYVNSVLLSFHWGKRSRLISNYFFSFLGRFGMVIVITRTQKGHILLHLKDSYLPQRERTPKCSGIQWYWSALFVCTWNYHHNEIMAENNCAVKGRCWGFSSSWKHALKWRSEAALGWQHFLQCIKGSILRETEFCR